VDGLGFMVAIKAHGFSVNGKRIAVIGGGGAGSAIAHALAEAGVDEIIIREINTKRHAFLMQLLKNVNPNSRIAFDLTSLEGLDCVVNATPLGMNDDLNLPFPTHTLGPSTLVADVVTHPKLTPWLAAALQKGCRVQYGVDMVCGQFGLMGRHMGLEIPDSEGLTFFQGD
jgi:shikimate dehydrogenase